MFHKSNAHRGTLAIILNTWEKCVILMLMMCIDYHKRSLDERYNTTILAVLKHVIALHIFLSKDFLYKNMYDEEIF